jgi:hypothetical protein
LLQNKVIFCAGKIAHCLVIPTSAIGLIAFL